MENTIDDGSLNFLKIPKNENDKSFHCKEIRQTDLLNLTFWVIDFFSNMETKFGKDRYLVKIKFDIDKPDTGDNVKKFFTNSSEIKYILDKIREMKAFPRKVTMKSEGNKFFFI